MTRQQKIVVTLAIILIVALAGYAVVPLVVAAIMGPGVKVGELDQSAINPATTDVDGQWSTVGGPHPHYTTAGFTFEELLPSDRRETSGLTEAVEATITIEEGTLTAGEVVVDMSDISTDHMARDENVRSKLFEVDTYPESRFVITEDVDVSHVGDDGQAVPVEVTGELTIKGHTEEITTELLAVRDEQRLIVTGDIPIDRNDFGVESPEMIAASIADEGEINLMLVMTKDEQ